jgi:hypothetical protein
MFGEPCNSDRISIFKQAWSGFGRQTILPGQITIILTSKIGKSGGR